MNVDYKLIGDRIKSARRARGYTQEQLAEKLDVTVGYVSQVERGITKISLDLLAKISELLECDISMLISGSVVASDNYMNTELFSYYSALDNHNKKLLMDFIKLLSSNNK